MDCLVDMYVVEPYQFSEFITVEKIRLLLFKSKMFVIIKQF